MAVQMMIVTVWSSGSLSTARTENHRTTKAANASGTRSKATALRYGRAFERSAATSMVSTASSPTETIRRSQLGKANANTKTPYDTTPSARAKITDMSKVRTWRSEEHTSEL